MRPGPCGSARLKFAQGYVVALTSARRGLVKCGNKVDSERVVSGIRDVGA
jgi:hypothetical protein